MSSRSKHRRSAAFTLIELILALALSAVLLALLSSALSLGVYRAVGSRKEVERARLLDGIISLMRSDIHRAVIYNPQDTSSAMELAEATAGFDVDSIDEISSGGPGGGGGGGGSSSGTSSTTDESLATPVSLRQPLGVYGTLQELQIHVLREHPQYEVDAAGAVVAPTAISGITTVRYALGQGQDSLALNSTSRTGQLVNGLVRQEVNRDLLHWATQAGSAATLVGTPKLVAPEVTQLEFRYFDGTQLLDTWDSELMQGQMPQAIELRMWVAEPVEDDASAVASSDPGASLPYVVTIALPSTWNAVDADVASATSSSTSSTSSSGASSTVGDAR